MLVLEFGYNFTVKIVPKCQIISIFQTSYNEQVHLAGKRAVEFLINETY